MAYDIGPKIGIDGEAEFRSSLRNITQNIKTLGTEMEAVVSSFTSNEKSVESLTAQNEVLNKQIDAQGEKLAELKKGLAAAAEKFGENDTNTLKWAQAVNKATADLNKMKSQLGENQQEITALNEAVKPDPYEEFKSAIDAVSQNIKTLGSEMKMVTSSFAGGEKSMESLAAQNEVLAKSIGEQEKKLALLRQGLSKSTAEYGEADAATQEWQRSVYEATAELNKMKSQLAKNEKAIDELGDEANAAERSLDDMGDAAEKSGGKFSALTVAAGNLVSGGIQAAVSAIGNMVGSLVNLDQTTEEYRIAQGKLQTAFEAAGYSAGTARQAYSAFYGILGDTDTAAEASQLLAKLADSAEDVSVWTDIAAGVAGTFGDALPIEGLIESANETARVGQVTGALADALNWASISEDAFNEKLAACGTESERNQLIMETLSATYDEASAAFYRNNEALIESRDAQAQMDESLAKLGGTISTLKNNLSSDFLPAISGVTGAFSDMLLGVEGASEALSAAVSGLIETAVGKLPEFITVGADMISGLVSGIIGAIPAVVESGAAIIPGIASGIQSAIPNLTSEAVHLISSLGAYIKENLSALMETGLSVVAKLSESFRANTGLIVDSAISLAISFASGLADSIPVIIEQVPTIVSNIANTINDNAPKILAAAVNIIATLAKGLIDAIPTLVANIPKIISAIVDTILAFNWVSLGTNIVTGLTNGIKNMVGSAKNVASQIGDAVKGGLKSLPTEMLQIGKNIMQGLWNGIKGMGAWLKDQVYGLIGGLVSGVKSTLGINSPSKVFAGIGGYMAEGLGQGFGNEMASVQRQINRSMNDLAGSASGTVSLQTASSAGAAGPSGAADIAAAVKETLAGMGIYLDKRKVGEMLSSYQGSTAKARGIPVTL